MLQAPIQNKEELVSLVRQVTIAQQELSVLPLVQQEHTDPPLEELSLETVLPALSELHALHSELLI